jgi:hypothetical protein
MNNFFSYFKIIARVIVCRDVWNKHKHFDKFLRIRGKIITRKKIKFLEKLIEMSQTLYIIDKIINKFKDIMM